MAHSNLGKFVVEKPSGFAPGQMVYLCRDREWTVYLEDAQVYKLRARADQAAARWGGAVRKLD